MKQKFKIGVPYNVTFEVDVRVSQSGLFRATIPASVAQLFKDAELACWHNGRGKARVYEEDTLEKLKTKIGEALTTLCSRELVSDEPVIRYLIDTACSYAVNEDTGDIRPWCYTGPGEQGRVQWHDGTFERNSNNPGPFGIQLWAGVYRKRVYKFNNGTERVEYDNIESENRFAKPDSVADPIRWLCSVPNCAPRADDYFKGDRFGNRVEEIPCTYENAMFFVNLFMSLFRLNERIKPFLNPEGIQLLASRGQNLLGS